MTRSKVLIALLILSFCTVSIGLSGTSYAKKPETVSVSENEVININTSSAEELQLIKGIGPKLASRIIAHRDQSGGFEVVEDILQVRGVGEAKFSKIKDSLTV